MKFIIKSTKKISIQDKTKEKAVETTNEQEYKWLYNPEVYPKYDTTIKQPEFYDTGYHEKQIGQYKWDKSKCYIKEAAWLE